MTSANGEKAPHSLARKSTWLSAIDVPRNTDGYTKARPGKNEIYLWSTMQHLLLLANDLKRKLDGPHRPNRKRINLKNESCG